jgi:Ca2+-binding RTX toxin-like protein
MVGTPPVSGGTMNTSNISGGVGSGNSVGSGEAVRVDFVNGISGNPTKNVSSADYSVAANQDHVFAGHNNVNGASANITSTSGSTIRIKAFDDNDTIPPDPDNQVGDGTSDNIDRVLIQYNGGEGSVDVIDGTGVGITVGGRLFTVTGDGNDVLVANVQGDSGDTPALFTNIAVFTDTGFTTVEYHWAGGDTFKLGGFGAATFDPGAAVNLTFDLVLFDGDGDSVLIPDAIDVLVSPDDHILQTGTSSSEPLSVAPATSGTLVGLAGDDTLTGHDGNDILVGGLGADDLTGGLGNDIFDYNAIAESGATPSTRDVITDFHADADAGAENDVIDLFGIDANSTTSADDDFTFVDNLTPGIDPGVSANSITWYQTGGTTTIIQGDVTGDTTADFQIELTGLHALADTDFIL